MTHLLKNSALLLVLLFAGLAAQAKNVIILADLDHGLALVPDGSDYPGVAVKGRDGKPLVFAHAPDEAFATARNVIASTVPQQATTKMFITHGSGSRSRIGSERLRVAPDDTDVTYYTYFYDGSWISARKQIIDYGFTIAYAVSMAGFAAENDYYNGWIYLEVSSSDHPGYDNYANCSIGSTGGSCSTPTYAYDDDANFTATVSCYGNVHQHRLPICGQYGEPPCNENLSTTITIYFP
jgi:hypothetical protein